MNRDGCTVRAHAHGAKPRGEQPFGFVSEGATVRHPPDAPRARPEASACSFGQPICLRGSLTASGVGCLLLVTAPLTGGAMRLIRRRSFYRLDGSQMMLAGGNPEVAQAGFHCGSLSRGWK